MCNSLHINTTGGYIGGGQQSHTAVAEQPHYFIPLLLRQVTMNGINIISFTGQFLGDVLRIGLGTGKHNSINAGIKINNPLQYFIAVMMLGHIIVVINIGIPLVHLTNGNLEGFIHIPFAYLANFRRHGGAE